MLFRLVRPVKRTGSRNRYFVRRIPSDVRSKAVGLTLSIPVGEQTQVVIVSSRAQSVRLSLRTDDPVEVKSRLAAVDAYLENVWRALREDAPVSLTHREATALAGELYRAWVNGEGRERAIAIVHTPGVGWQGEYNTHVSDSKWEAVRANWEKLGATGETSDLEKPLGAIVGRLLLAKGINRVDETTRSIILPAFWQALRDAFETRKRFKTVGNETGIEHRILDSIQGHHPRNVAEGYGEVTIKTQETAIAKLPHYKVSE